MLCSSSVLWSIQSQDINLLILGEVWYLVLHYRIWIWKLLTNMNRAPLWWWLWWFGIELSLGTPFQEIESSWPFNEKKKKKLIFKFLICSGINDRSMNNYFRLVLYNFIKIIFKKIIPDAAIRIVRDWKQ